MTDDSGRTSLLKSYATKSLPADELDAANEDLCYCLECVDGYHKARDEVPSLHEVNGLDLNCLTLCPQDIGANRL